MKNVILIVLLCMLISHVAVGQDAGGSYTYDTVSRKPSNRQLYNDMRRQTENRRIEAEEQSRSSGQEQTESGPAKTKRRGRWHVGGSFGLGFGDYTSISIMPQVGYSWNKYFMLGGGVSYNYYDENFYDYTANYLGIHTFARAYPVDHLMLYVQPEALRRWSNVGGVTGTDSFMALLLGAGVVVPIGNNGGMTISLFYDVLQNRHSPYGNSIGYSVGYIFNF